MVSDIPKPSSPRRPASRWRAESRRPMAGGPHAAIRSGRRRPRILFVNQYYWPDHASTAQHLTDLAESLADRGYECHVLCARGRYEPGVEPPPAEEEHNGVRIHRVRATSLGRGSVIKRMADYLSFYLGAFRKAFTLPGFDVVVTLTTPPIIGLVGTLLRRLRGSCQVYWSMDLHPDASLALGQMSRRNPVVALLSWLSDAVYRQSDRVVVLGPYMADRIRSKGVRDSRMIEIPVWSRLDEVYPIPREGHPMREALGLSGKFVVMYSGNLGMAHSAVEFVEAARRLRDRDDVVFLFVGGGPRLREVKEAKRLEGLENVRLLDYVPREQLHESLTVADAHLVSMRPEMTGIVVPGKLYGAMASERPVLFVGPDHSETADTIRRAGCGVTVRLGEAEALVRAIEHLAADPGAAAEMGRKGREAFLAEFERDGCCDRWAELMGELAGDRRPAAVPDGPAVASASA
ncbi:glycosyltransferase family 4 protein [Tautonia plasticadhaerens]|uniref:GDP-mannose-dependent alpha-(1-6)-phosphatidylinositol monomannoside mannosyltransferase n=1 Tax=Tautonia plasticadhaerens TaxID=2527974 RepID=A0A518GYF5_9BACT|nr:glycosyltransferase family 4 protein [Tautonia plasticadhaerens]QDV33626.1 GDP-mannose-dependent alpha-(1-6)-phosphatidylinositol monomannoside mannosyltransferase [Tautonia plasticadhaerens]